jgi:mycothiol synthase
MADLSKRPYRPDDAKAFADLLQLIEEHGGGHGGWLADDTNSMISELVRDPEVDTELVFDAGQNLIAAAVTTSPPPPNGYQAELMGGVHPKWRGQGIGRELFARQLERATANHREHDPLRDWEIQASAMTGDEDALRLFQRFGLAPARYWFEMVASTASPVAMAVPAGLRVETYTAEREMTVFHAHMEAFKDHWGFQEWQSDTWLPLTVRATTFIPDLSRLAFDGDELAGYVLCYRDSDPDRLYVGHVGTRRSWRRRGVAGSLLADVIAAAKAAGYGSAALGVDADSPTGAVGVYERVGFTVDAKAVTWLKPLPAGS